MKKIAILGSTGSIGTQTLEVINSNKNIFKVELLTANSNFKLLAKQANKFNPKVVIINDVTWVDELSKLIKNPKIEILNGTESLNNFSKYCEIDLVVTAVVGKSGLLPTVNAINNNVDIALANKETLVVAGRQILNLLKKSKSKLLPVDSEHSAIFQCLNGEKKSNLEKIILTASGGPFRGKDLNFLKSVSKENALNHPNWEMGKKISIDSSSLMNKGLEVIEAKFLFDIDIKDIDVVIHPESIIHSMVQFNDGSIIAQLGEPDMRLPIQYALGYPERLNNSYKRYDFINSGSLNFEKPCYKTFNNLKLAFDAAEKEGNSPCILNAANEVVVSAFLKDKIKFLDMTYIIEESLNKISYIANPNLDQLIETDRLTREYTQEKIKKY
ncbi:MAG: 1-deoxy-D-xylulose-5-phosphate reductoisomerase [Flammeovirgaceae bacterium]|nr:1-deoxy-D-xylulose-5-phosphate reductoisomerase [Flammeovirgaceae bacterium]|tara:strand:+ start:307 stop:1461 length:1155 start_codon:yes stop_codon:yes gene_type:complete